MLKMQSWARDNILACRQHQRNNEIELHWPEKMTKNYKVSVSNLISQYEYRHNARNKNFVTRQADNMARLSVLSRAQLC